MRLILFCGLLLVAGCDNGVYAPPRQTPPRKTSANPAAGDYAHDDLSPDFIGNDSRTAAQLYEVMRMRPPVASPYSTGSKNELFQNENTRVGNKRK